MTLTGDRSALDNWGGVARFGILIVGGEVVPEAEWWAMAPAGISIHAARVSAPAPWATWDGARQRVNLVADLERGARQLAHIRPDAVVVAHTSSSVVGGAGWDEATVEALSPLLPDCPNVTTNGLDCLAALRAKRVQRPFIVLPPWFGDAFAQNCVSYFVERRLSPSGYLIHKPDKKWQHLRPDELYGAFMHIEQRIDLLFDEIVRDCPAGADSVFIGGTGFRCVGIIEALEKQLQRPVVTANQASLWNSMRRAHCNQRVKGYGSLLLDC